MARIRSIKPEFWSSEQVMECSPTARLLFIGLWNFCDDAGNHVASLKTIKAEVFPGDDISTSSIRQLLDELSSNGLIVYYTSENKDFLNVTGWHHQKIDRPTYKHPPFPGEGSQGTRRTLAEASPPEGRGVEGSGEEGKGEDSCAAPAKPAPASAPPVVLIPITGGDDFPITQDQVDEFAGLYPAVNVLQELRSMRGWCIANPTKRKTKNGVLRFVTNWLAREQDKGGKPAFGNGRAPEPERHRELL